MSIPPLARCSKFLLPVTRTGQTRRSLTWKCATPASTWRRIEPPNSEPGAVQLTRIAERDGWWCWLCGEAIEPDAVGPWQPTIDHLVPRSRGGSSELSNLRLAHRRCNNHRGSHLPELDWPRDWPMLLASNLWTSLARLAPGPAAGGRASPDRRRTQVRPKWSRWRRSRRSPTTRPRGSSNAPRRSCRAAGSRGASSSPLGRSPYGCGESQVPCRAQQVDQRCPTRDVVTSP